jgi:UDP-3-O-[3-hydroxymyristoyl] glucosamine N-acyltransferase
MLKEWRKTETGCFIHTTAIIEPWVKMGKGCVVNPYAVVGRLPAGSKALARKAKRIRELTIGDNVEIGCNAVVFGGVEIGDDSLIGDFAHIREQSKIGSRCVIGRYVAVSYESQIADDCRLQDATVFTGIAGKGCFFGVGVVMSNDRRIDLKDYKFKGVEFAVFGERVMVGSGANILAGVKIGDDVVIGAGALVVKDVAAGYKVLGVPGDKVKVER